MRIFGYVAVLCVAGLLAGGRGAGAYERGSTTEEVQIVPESNDTSKTKRDPKDESKTRTKAIERHIQGLKDPDADVRQNSAWMLGVMNATEAIEPLIEALQDKHILVEMAAHGALNKITGKNFGYKNYAEWRSWYEGNKDEIEKQKNLGISEMNRTRGKSSNTQGLIYLHNGSHAQAYPLFLDAVNQDPEVPDYRNNLGLAVMELGRPIDAMSYFEEAIGLDDSQPQPYMNIGQCFSRLNRHIEAQHWYRRAMARDRAGKYWEACWTLGKEFLVKGDFHMAQEFLEQARSKAEKNHKRDPRIYRDLALTDYGLDMYHSAWREIKNLHTLGHELNPEFEQKVRDALKAQGVDPDKEDEEARRIARERAAEAERALYTPTGRPRETGGSE